MRLTQRTNLPSLSGFVRWIAESMDNHGTFQENLTSWEVT